MNYTRKLTYIFGAISFFLFASFTPNNLELIKNDFQTSKGYIEIAIQPGHQSFTENKYTVPSDDFVVGTRKLSANIIKYQIRRVGDKPIRVGNAELVGTTDLTRCICNNFAPNKIDVPVLYENTTGKFSVRFGAIFYRYVAFRCKTNSDFLLTSEKGNYNLMKVCIEKGDNIFGPLGQCNSVDLQGATGAAGQSWGNAFISDNTDKGRTPGQSQDFFNGMRIRLYIIDKARTKSYPVMSDFTND